MKKKTKTLILSVVITLVLLLTFTVSYALFAYQETGLENNQLVMGDIYMHYKENNQLILNNAMPRDGFKTLITGYKVNPIMATQDAKDTSTELYKCINLFQNEWEWGLDEGEDFESFCKGTGTSWGWTLQMLLDDMSVDENGYNELLSLNIIQEETLEYTSIKLNPEIKEQTSEYENELTACVALFNLQGISEVLDEGSTTETFCQGTGTISNGITLQQFWDANNQQDGFIEPFGNTLINNDIMVLENDLYIVNPNMTNQEVGEINELMTCIGIFTREGYEFDEGTTAESFCKGEGTYDDGITLKKEFEYNSDNIYYMMDFGNDLLDNNIIIASVDLPYFEFTISGKNTYSEQDIYYDIKLNHGDPHDERTIRLEDNFLKFRLIEVNPDKTEKIIFDNKSYFSIENKVIHVETISKNTMNEINKTYRLYMWINEDVVIGNYNQDYTLEEWNDVFASIKVNVTGDFGEKEVAYEDKYDVTDESCFTTEEIKTYTHNTNMTEEELATCVTYITDLGWEEYQVEGETIETFCDGTGTNEGATFQEFINNSRFTEERLIYLEENNVITSEIISLSITDYDANCGSDVVIPKTINGLSVVEIGSAYNETTYEYENSFANKNLTSVVIPDSVTIIGEGAFYNNQLESVVIPDSVTYIEGGAFDNNQLASVVIPNSVTEIGGLAFANNQLASIVIPNSVIRIEDYAFSDNQLTSVTFEEDSKLYHIGYYAFAGSDHTITEVTIPNSVASLNCQAFNYGVIVHKSDNLTCVATPF